jgi:hypothetical protein
MTLATGTDDVRRVLHPVGGRDADPKVPADSRGIEVVYRDSFTSGAFYQKQGYEAFGTLQDAPQGFFFQWFCKRLPRVHMARPPGD